MIDTPAAPWSFKFEAILLASGMDLAVALAFDANPETRMKPKFLVLFVLSLMNASGALAANLARIECRSPSHRALQCQASIKLDLNRRYEDQSVAVSGRITCTKRAQVIHQNLLTRFELVGDLHRPHLLRAGGMHIAERMPAETSYLTITSPHETFSQLTFWDEDKQVMRQIKLSCEIQ